MRYEFPFLLLFFLGMKISIPLGKKKVGETYFFLIIKSNIAMEIGM